MAANPQESEAVGENQETVDTTEREVADANNVEEVKEVTQVADSLEQTKINDDVPEEDVIVTAVKEDGDTDSLVPVTGSINGDLDDHEDVASDPEPETEEEEENMSNVVQGTTETILNKLEENLSQAPEVEESDLLQISEPGPLDKEGKDIEQVLGIISNSIYREGEGQIFSKLCDRSSLLSVVSHSLSAYITTLEPGPLQRLSARIACEVSLWMCSLFHYPSGLSHCHDDIREGLVRVVRMVTHANYQDLETRGYMALAEAPPVIYLTSPTYAEVARYVCNQLCLPESTVRLLSPEPPTLEGLEAMIAEDKGAGKKPLLAVANVHSTLFNKQSVLELQRVCKENGVWLHLEGHALSALTLLPDQGESDQLQWADSMTLTFGSWLGIPSVPFVTLYRKDCPSAQIAGLGVVSPSVRLPCLPLWCVLRSLGQDQVRARIRGVHTMLEQLSSGLSNMTGLRMLSQAGERTTVPVAGLESGEVEQGLVFNTVSPAIAFQYVSETPPDLTQRVPPYTDNLNSWLGQILQRDAAHIPVEIVDVETTGYVLRICPFEDVGMVGLAKDEVDNFLQVLQEKCDILNATVTQRAKFIQLIEAEPSVQHVDIAHWAGLGGVRYIPKELMDEDGKVHGGEGVEGGQDTINKLINQRNMELVATLRNTDAAFSLGEGPPPEAHMCVRFGMVTRETEVGELLGLVISTGKEIDMAVDQLESMSEVVRKGVVQAQEELRREADNKIWQEGILRHVPIVGSFYNWLSPVPEEAKVKGRYLNLQEGKLETTEKIYKHHHMQIHIEDGQEL